MLPDFPDLKKKLNRKLVSRMKNVHASQNSAFSEVPFVHIPEGNRVMTVDEEGYESELEMKHHQVSISIRDDEVESLSPEEMARRFDEAAKDMAVQTRKTFVESLDKSVRSVGNVIEHRGKLTVNDMFRMIDKIQIDFDRDGRPELPTLFDGHRSFGRITDIFPELETDPDLKQRYEEAIARKYEEWRDRESSRKLVG